MQEPCVQQLFHYDRETTDAVKVDHVVQPMGLHVRDVGHFPADPVEVVER